MPAADAITADKRLTAIARALKDAGADGNHCDLDHTIAYQQGGRTCECNLAPFCRRHHKVRQARGWHVTQPEPGTLTWTTPNGRSYTVTPAQYPR